MTNAAVVDFCRKYKYEYFDFDSHAARFRYSHWDFVAFKIVAILEGVWMNSMDRLNPELP